MILVAELRPLQAGKLRLPESREAHQLMSRFFDERLGR
jgi:hypothetical protein